MPLRAFLILYRRRLWFAALVVLSVLPGVFMITSAKSPLDLGVFWGHSCGYAAKPRDATLLLATTSMLCGVVGLIFGFPTESVSVPGGPNQTRFLLTRPISRTALQFCPLGIAAAAIVMLPLLGWFALLGWLRLVHAPALQHLTAIVELVPAASRLGGHPSVRDLVDTLHLARRLLAAISVGLLFYALLDAFRHLAISRRKRVRQIGSLCLVFSPVLLWLPFRISGVFSSTLLLLPKNHADLSYLPSTEGIALHFVFVVACIGASFVALHDWEL